MRCSSNSITLLIFVAYLLHVVSLSVNNVLTIIQQRVLGCKHEPADQHIAAQTATRTCVIASAGLRTEDELPINMGQFWQHVPAAAMHQAKIIVVRFRVHDQDEDEFG